MSLRKIWCNGHFFRPKMGCPINKFDRRLDIISRSVRKIIPHEDFSEISQAIGPCLYYGYPNDLWSFVMKTRRAMLIVPVAVKGRELTYLERNMSNTAVSACCYVFFSIVLLAIYSNYCSLIGYATRYLFCDRRWVRCACQLSAHDVTALYYYSVKITSLSCFSVWNDWFM